MLILIIVCLGAILLLGIYIFLYKREVHRINEQLEWIIGCETNKKITLSSKPREIQKLATQLNRLLTEYKEEKIALTKAQNDFKDEIMNISHDLRTPLTSIVGYIQMIESPQTSEEKREEYYRIVRDRVEKLMKMIDEFFLLTRTESEDYPLELQKLNVTNVLIESLSMYYEDFVAKNLEPVLEFSSQNVFILGDKEALHRMFQNLIQNFFRHGEGNLHISLQEENDKVHIIFQNAAPNLTPDGAKRLFQRFYTQDRSRNRSSTGLGLAIVKNLVQKMKGNISAYINGNHLNIKITFQKI